MIKRTTLLCAILGLGTIASAQQSAQSQGLLSRLRGDAPSTRQQLQNEPRQIAQPANAPQGYAPGVTFPQAQQQQPPPQQSGPVYPAYPPQAQTMPYNVSPPVATPRPTQAPTRSRSTDNDEKEESSNRSSSRSGSGTSRSSSSNSDANNSKSNSTTRKPSSTSTAKKEEAPVKKSEAPESNTESAASTENESSNTKSPSALQKIVKKVESGKEDETETAKPAEPKKTKEELEAEKVREAALKSADKATTVVAGFLKLANDGYYSKANDHLAPAIRKYFESEISAVNGTQKIVLDELTANGTITMVTYVNTTVRGEGAVVEAELGYENGRTARRSFDLIELENEWKIVLPVTDSAVANSATVATSAQAPTATPAPAASNAPASVPPPTPEQAAASAAGPLVLAPADTSTTAPPQ